jgi:mRNA interferase MazF
VPDSGELIWLTFDPQAAHEQAGRRPALVLSPKLYNHKAGLALCCPVTNEAKGYAFEVALPEGCGVAGVVLADHLKSVEWKVREARRIGRAPEAIMLEVLARIAPLLGL